MEKESPEEVYKINEGEEKRRRTEEEAKKAAAQINKQKQKEEEKKKGPAKTNPFAEIDEFDFDNFEAGIKSKVNPIKFEMHDKEDGDEEKKNISIGEDEDWDAEFELGVEKESPEEVYKINEGDLSDDETQQKLLDIDDDWDKDDRLS